LKRQQLQRLALRMNRSLTEVFEEALDALEEKLSRGKAGK
jgi:predicted transcriptional regulator